MYKFIATVVAATTFATGASALTIIDGNSAPGFELTAGSVPAGGAGAANADNDFLEAFGDSIFGALPTISGNRKSLDGFFGAQLSGTAPSYLFEFYGSEASFNNTFTVGGNSFSTGGGTGGGSGTFTNLGNPIASFTSTSLDFVFSTSGNGTTASNAGLGTNRNNTGDAANVVNFFATCGLGAGRDCNSVWLFLDDGGANENDNHDDMIVRVSAVPVPAALPMLGAAVAGLGFMARRRRKQA